MLRLLQTCTFGCHWAAPWSPSASSPASLTHSTRGSRQTSHRCPSQATLSLWKQSWFHSWSWCWRPPMLIVLLPCARKVVSLGLYLAGPPLSGWEEENLNSKLISIFECLKSLTIWANFRFTKWTKEHFERWCCVIDSEQTVWDFSSCSYFFHSSTVGVERRVNCPINCQADPRLIHTLETICKSNSMIATSRTVPWNPPDSEESGIPAPRRVCRAFCGRAPVGSRRWTAGRLEVRKLTSMFSYNKSIFCLHLSPETRINSYVITTNTN